MKCKIALLSVLSASLFYFSSCKKDDDNDQTPSDSIPTADTIPPVASFTFTCGGCQAPSVTAFTDNSQYAKTYFWDFGNGETSTEKNPACTYNAGGIFTVTLTVTNAKGNNTQSAQVTITPDPALGLTYLSEDFESQTNQLNIVLAGWSNVNVQGARHWIAQEYAGNIQAKVSAYQSFAPVMETWMITPKLNLSIADTLNFRSQQGYWDHDGFSVWISTDYDGSNVTAATWQPLTCTLPTSTSGQFVWVNSGDCLLTSFSGSCYIGFKYTGGDPGQLGEFDFDDVIVH